MFLIRGCIQSWESQNRETTHSDPPIVTRSSQRTITKSGVRAPSPVSCASDIVVRPRERTHDHQHRDKAQFLHPRAEATHAPLNPRSKIRTINAGGAVRLGVFGSFSVTSSTKAKIVKITTAVMVPIQERGLGTFGRPKSAAQAFTAGGAKIAAPRRIRSKAQAAEPEQEP